MFNPSDLPTSGTGDQEESYLATLQELKRLDETNTDGDFDAQMMDAQMKSEYRRSEVIVVTPYTRPESSVRLSTAPAADDSNRPASYVDAPPLEFVQPRVQRDRLPSTSYQHASPRYPLPTPQPAASRISDEEAAAYLQPFMLQGHQPRVPRAAAQVQYQEDEAGYLTASDVRAGPAIVVNAEDGYMTASQVDEQRHQQEQEEAGYLTMGEARAGYLRSDGPAVSVVVEDGYMTTSQVDEAQHQEDEGGYLQLSELRASQPPRLPPPRATHSRASSQASSAPSFGAPYFAAPTDPSIHAAAELPPPILFSDADDPEGAVPEFDTAPVSYDHSDDVRAALESRRFDSYKPLSPAEPLQLREFDHYYASEPAEDYSYDPNE